MSIHNNSCACFECIIRFLIYIIFLFLNYVFEIKYATINIRTQYINHDEECG